MIKMRKNTRKEYNRAIQKGYPILLGIKQHGQLWVWCPRCRKFHFHGIGEGLRGSHCKDYRTTLYNGYQKGYLVLDIDNLKNKKGALEDPTYEYDKHLDHIEGHREKMKIRYKLEKNS